jgi:RNA-binding protein
MINTKQRAYLRSLAQKESVILQIGKAGITEAVTAQAREALLARELVKGRVLENSMLTPREAQDALCAACGAEGVQVIGNVFSLYKRNPKAAKITLPE